MADLIGYRDKEFTTGHTIRIRCTATQDVVANTSTVNVSVYYIVADGWNIHKGDTASEVKIRINGTTYTGSGNIGDIEGYGAVKLWVKTITLEHDSDGTKSFTVSASVAVNATLSGTYYGTISLPGSSLTSASDTMALNPIPRGTTVSINSVTAASNTSLNIKWTAGDTCTKVEYSTNNGSTFTTHSASAGKSSGTITVTGLSSGTTYNCKVRVTCNGITTTSSAVSGTTKYLASFSSISNCVISSSNTAVSFSISNQSSYYIKIKYFKINVSGTESNITLGTNIGQASGSKSVTIYSILGSIGAKIPTSKTCSFRLTMEIYSDSGYSNLVATINSAYATLTFDDDYIKPTLSTLTVSLDSATQNILGSSNTSMIQNFTTATCTMSGLSLKYGATVSSYTLTYVSNGTTRAIANSSTGKFISVVYGSIKIVATVKDSRGLTVTKEVSVNVLEYYPPTITANVCKDAESSGTINLQNLLATYTKTVGSYTNSATLRWGYNTSGTASESDLSSTINDYSSINDGVLVNISYSKSSIITGATNIDNYQFIFMITDSLGSKSIFKSSLLEAVPIMRFLQNGQVSINSAVNGSNILTVGGTALFDGTIVSKGHTTSSDIRLKTDFETLDKYEDVYMDLKPFSYKFIKEKNGLIHFGFGAQPTMEAFEKHGFSSDKFAGVREIDGLSKLDAEYGITYEEYIAWNTYMTQNNIKRLKMQDEKITNLENELATALELINILLQERDSRSNSNQM